MTRRGLLDAMTALPPSRRHLLTSTGSVRNAEAGDTLPSPAFLTAWLLALGQDPDQDVMYYPRHGGDLAVLRAVPPSQMAA